MKKLLIIFLICLLLPLSGSAITYGLTGKDTNFTGDVNVPSGSGYYVNAVEMVKFSKFDATAAPDADNDVDEGYVAGSRWVDVTNDKEYVCLDNTDGAAVWTETTGAGAGGGDVSKVGTPVDNQIGVWTGDGTIEGDANLTYDGTTLVLGNGQVNFPDAQNASADVNTLDDYEEGSWTPVLTFATPGDLSVSYSYQVGKYTKIGNRVIVNFSIITSAFTHTTASGDLAITGLPFTSESTILNHHVGAAAWSGITKANYTHIVAQINQDTTQIAFPASGSGQARTQITAADMPTTGTVELRGTVIYQI